MILLFWCFFFSSSSRHTRWPRDWSSDVCSSDLSTYYLFRQLQWFVLGLIGFIITCLFPYKKYQKMTFIIVIGSFILLARSEERRVGKAYRCRWWTSQQSKRGTS